MAVLGSRAIKLTQPAHGHDAGKTVTAQVILNTDRYEPCAELAWDKSFGRLSDGGWKFANAAEQAEYESRFPVIHQTLPV